MKRRSSKISRSARTRLIMLSVSVLVVLGGAGGAYAATHAQRPPDGASRRAVNASTAGPGQPRLLDAFGLTHARPHRVARLGNGDTVSVVRGRRGRCILRSDSGKPAGEACVGRRHPPSPPRAKAADLSEGSGIAVYDECGTSGENGMQIIGLAPEGTAKVRLLISDSSTTTTQVHKGAFTFEGTNPGPSDPYPTGVQWLSSGGVSEGSAPLPVNGSEFCLPAEEPEQP